MPRRRYPADPHVAPAGFRGRVEIDFARCRLSGDCADACPTDALRLEHDPRAREAKLVLDLGHCVFCGLCEEACGEGAVKLTGEFELAVARRDDLVTTAFYGGAAKPPAKASSTGASAAKVGPTLRERALDLLGRSVLVRHIDAGSCNACESELVQAASPIHDLTRFGVSFVASPAHADVLLVTGVVTEAMRTVVQSAWDAMPEPRQVIAMGACAIGGGIFAGAYPLQASGLDPTVPVDLFVPGCPPRPEAILHAFLVLLDRRKQKLESTTWRGAYPAEAMRS